MSEIDAFAAPPPGVALPSDSPSPIGRYRVDKILSEGSSGRVYLACDEPLGRLVAIKVSDAGRVRNPEEVESYLAKARRLVALDHPGIVPVYDFGRTDDGLCFVVSKRIEGSDLAAQIAIGRPAFTESAHLIATVADALHHAHQCGLIHRNIKPANLLLDRVGRPLVTDFGLASSEEDIGPGTDDADRPAYLSPEQARGEGHRVDGRSDLFSLGVVLYELLTGRQPFSGETQAELLDQITSAEPRSPRQVNPLIPMELERICLKAMAKRASDRYSTAKELAEDLRQGTVALVRAAGGFKHAFLSYASPDQEAAFHLCRLLEERGVGCWIAPRDVALGADYGEAIIDAIESTSTTLLLLSTHANASIHVRHEVERATSKRKRLIPVRLEEVQPSRALELHLSAAQWVDAWRHSPEQVADRLAPDLRVRDGEAATTARPMAFDIAAPMSQPIQIVPKGLRSFDSHDADFFLDLLPGPRDRDGLPDSLRFWKTRIEETDTDKTFPVGLICGPSGCGKSSLVKAGLLPRLSGEVVAVYVESTGEETETRLSNGLRKHCPLLPVDSSLKDTLAALRRGQGIPPGKKVLIVLDQFEQWLHARKEQENTELVQALRQCDGGRVQCVVMVRDDFWMAVIRFMRELEVRLVEGHNSAAVDLFPIRHAEKVLMAFGRSYGVLPEDVVETSREFVARAVSSLSQEGKVIPVRLALFAEMMKGKAWTAKTLKAVGGAEGVGVTFLEETFSTASAPPEHRYHQKAARAVLKSLLPDAGTDIKGHMRSHAELVGASGYRSQPREFADLLDILDGEVRLITPTDPEGKEGPMSEADPGQKYYQLTHDYLVPSLRDWLSRHQSRAERLLADRAAVWKARPERRQLPSLLEWLSIRGRTREKDWTSPQREMMQKAGRYHAVRALAVAVCALLLGWAGWEGFGTLEAHALRDRLLSAGTAEVPNVVTELARYRRWADPLLRQAAQDAAERGDTCGRLHTGLALLPVDVGQADYLYLRLLDADLEELPVLVKALAPHKGDLADRLWAVAEEKGPRRLRAAAALAAYDADDSRWKTIAGGVTEDLVSVPTVHLANWVEALRPARARLLAPLSAVYRDVKRRETDRSMATDILADYANDQAELLVGLVLDADEKQFAVLFANLALHKDQAIVQLSASLERSYEAKQSADEKEILAKRQAGAAVALLRLGQGERVWPLLKHRPDPRLRSYLVHWLASRGADPLEVSEQIGRENDVSIRRALLLALGEFGSDRLSVAQRERLTPTILRMVREEPDAGLHAAAEWLLRRWAREDSLKEIEQEWVRDRAKRESRLSRLEKKATRAGSQWYVNGQGMTMVVTPGPVTFSMGVPTTEANRNFDEVQHQRRIGRSFALAAKPVTVEQYLRFDREHELPEAYFRDRKPDLPVVATSWFQAAAYCNWLSKQEGIDEAQWCYEIDGKVLRAKENYLSLTGYRLPTEAEVEYATRAGASTSRFFGETDELLAKYAWYQANSRMKTSPVGLLKPNDLGFFDVQGNVNTWCQESYKNYPVTQPGGVVEDQEDSPAIINTISRVLRGSSFGNLPSEVRSGCRHGNVPTARLLDSGFRPARTLR